MEKSICLILFNHADEFFDKIRMRGRKKRFYNIIRICVHNFQQDMVISFSEEQRNLQVDRLSENIRLRENFITV